MTWIAVLIRITHLVGLLALVPGLWYLAGGLRVVVSGRIDERNRSGSSLKKGAIWVIVGVLSLMGGACLNWFR